MIKKHLRGRFTAEVLFIVDAQLLIAERDFLVLADDADVAFSRADSQFCAVSMEHADRCGFAFLCPVIASVPPFAA